MEPRLTDQSEAILAKLKAELPAAHLNVDELRQVRKGLALVESLGVLTRFIIGLAAMAAAITGLFNFWPGGGR